MSNSRNPKTFYLLWALQFTEKYIYKVSARNSQKKYDFCNTQISREYFGELPKC